MLYVNLFRVRSTTAAAAAAPSRPVRTVGHIRPTDIGVEVEDNTHTAIVVAQIVVFTRVRVIRSGAGRAVTGVRPADVALGAQRDSR
jgi:hypothetical protein